MRKLLIPKRETKYENQILNCTNKIVAKIVSEYSKNEIHFIELYQIGISKWKEIERNFSEKNIIKSGALIIRQEILNYTLKMENKNSELEKLQKEVVQFYCKLELELGEKIDCKIFYSQFSTEADVLFIGINPGTGETGIRHDVEPMLNFAYLDWGKSVKISRETIDIFNLAQIDQSTNLLKELDVKNKIVKTNLYYLATRNTNDLDAFKNKLSITLRDEFQKNSEKWTLKIIELTNPKIIIYEGTSAFNNSPPFYNANDVLEEFNDNDIFWSRLKNFDFLMLGYSRHPTIDRNKVKEKTAKILKIELDKIYK